MDKIKERAISESYKQTEGTQCTEFTKGYRIGFQIGHEAGATEWAGKAQPAIDTIEQIANSPVPTNEREMASWIETARNLAETALAKYKEVGK